MAAESSRKTEVAPHVAPGGCPRCGTRLNEPYKYCPNCAYRLRPDLVPAPYLPRDVTPLSQRAVALGGYLLFASMLLLVVFAGVRLFARPVPPDLVQPKVLRARDGNCLALTLDEFVAVPPGTAFWGVYDPGRGSAARSGAEAAARETEAAARVAETLQVLGSDAATRKDVDEARKEFREALSAHASVQDAIRQWADALEVVVPHDPAEDPEAYLVEDGFRMASREVTNDQYFEFLRAWARKMARRVSTHLIPANWTRATGSRDVPKIYREHEGNLPVVGIPFDAALEFCGWYWEERLGADPDLVVDLPTWKEYILAARGDRLTYNFPWGRTLHEGEKVNIGTSELWSVTREDAKFYDGFLDLVGNAREWVYWRDDPFTTGGPRGLILAAGWSCDDEWVLNVVKGQGGQPGRLVTPFSRDGFRIVDTSSGLNDVGFRPVIRRAKAVPSFVAVAAGPVRHGPSPEDLLPPERVEAEESDEGEDSMPETLDRIRRRREPPTSFAAETERVERDFEISATEVTNRQYLAFLAAISPGSTKDRLEELVPDGWRRDNRLVRWEDNDRRRPSVPRAYDGYYVPYERLGRLYTAGQENAPVQGITVEQAEAYASWLSGRFGRRCTIPTVAQYLRAGRGGGIAPYPWGEDRNNVELLPSCRPEPDSLPRALALNPSLARPIVGLAGNVAELVRDESADGRVLLAGGFYDLPARLCTLDCFLDANWVSVQHVRQPEDGLQEDEEPSDLGDPSRPKLSAPYGVAYHAGFRVVRLADRF